MTHSQFHASLVFGAIVVLASVALLAPPVPPASAEVQAARICREQGVKPASPGYDYCLMQAEQAIEWGEPQLARAFARVTAEAREACQGYGLEPTSAGYQACLDRETKARRLLVFSEEKLNFGPQLADHP
jgi:K+-transporting ATPase c subunit